MTTAGRILVVDDTAFNRRLLVRLLDGHRPRDRWRRRTAGRPSNVLRGPGHGARRRRPARHRDARDGRLRDARGAQGGRGAARPAGHRHLRRRRARQRRPLHPDGRDRLPAQDGRSRDPARPDRGVAGPEAAARPRARDAGRAGRLLATIDRQRSSCRASCRPRSRRSSRATTARRCWPAIAARSPRCSATFATSRSSPRPPSPRRCSASCAPITPRWARSSSSTRARSSISPATGS